MQQNYEQQQRLNPGFTLYHCNICNYPANHPVLTPCGHLFCWHCLYPYNECQVCGQQFHQGQLFSVFVESNEILKGQQLPPKPKPKYSKQIKNYSSLSPSDGGSGLMRSQNNLQRGQMIAGYGLFPPLLINSLSSMQSQQQQQQFKYKNIVNRIQIFLMIVICVMFLLS